LSRAWTEENGFAAIAAQLTIETSRHRDIETSRHPTTFLRLAKVVLQKNRVSCGVVILGLSWKTAGQAKGEDFNWAAKRITLFAIFNSL
jgi:hypothetical protein